MTPSLLRSSSCWPCFLSQKTVLPCFVLLFLQKKKQLRPPRIELAVHLEGTTSILVASMRRLRVPRLREPGWESRMLPLHHRRIVLDANGLDVRPAGISNTDHRTRGTT